MTHAPALFVSQGAPTFALEPGLLGPHDFGGFPPALHNQRDIRQFDPSLRMREIGQSGSRLASGAAV